MQQEAYLTVKRLSPRTGVLRRIAVHVDTRQVGSLWVGQRRVFALQPGEHTVDVQLGNSKSNQMAVELRDGETLDLVVTGAFTSTAIFFWPFCRGPLVDLFLAPATT